MPRRYEPERGHFRERGFGGGREQHDRDRYGEYPGQFGGDYDDDERHSGSRNAYAEGERETGGWGNRTEGGRDDAGAEHGFSRHGERDLGERRYGGHGRGENDWGRREYGGGNQGYGNQGYGNQGYRGQGRIPERRYGGYGGPEYGMQAPGGSRDTRQPSRDRWEATEYSGVPGGPGQESLSRGFRGRGPRGYSRSDERVREEICERLTDEDIDVSEVEVSVTKGEVTLSGSVADRRTKREAENIAEQITGVKDVSNQIRVRSENEHRGSSSSAASRSANSTGENDKRAH